MNHEMESADSLFLAPDDFPTLEGQRMCPRCTCCAVGVGQYETPFEVFGWLARILPSDASSLLSEPSHETSAKPEAWFCKGACDAEGRHPPGRGPHAKWKVPPSFLGRVGRR